jgi:hypothetical protein
MNVMKFCPECYKELPPNATTCPFCGFDTGNGDAEEAFHSPLQAAAEGSSRIPLEQTILSLLVLFLLFWGLSAAATLLPIFINPLYHKWTLYIALGVQIILRIPVGIWALQEQSFHKNLSIEKKIGNFLLAFVPLGAIVSFHSAAKNIVRTNRLSEVFIGSLGALATAAILTVSTADLILGIDLITDPSIPQAAAVVTEISAVENEETANQESSESSEETEEVTSPLLDLDCQDPTSVLSSDEGTNLTVCGKVTNYGDIDCPECPNGYYSYIKLDGDFQIVSYDWRFTFAWLGDCLKVADEVEILGEDPVFVFGRGEGFAGTECITDSQGELVCDGGFYFQDYFGCTE